MTYLKKSFVLSNTHNVKGHTHSHLAQISTARLDIYLTNITIIKITIIYIYIYIYIFIERERECVCVCVCVCVCLCVCGHVYVVYEDTNLYNDMGMT